jgi:hypothetical protein
MIVGELLEFSVTEAIGPAVADMPQYKPFFAEGHQLRRTSHPLVPGLLSDMVQDAFIGHLEGLLDHEQQPGDRIGLCLGENLQAGIGKIPAGQLPCRSPAHAVGHQAEVEI